MARILLLLNKIIFYCFLFLYFVTTVSSTVELRDKKHEHAFKQFYDFDGNGKFDKSDVNALVERFVKSKGLQVNGKEHNDIKNSLHEILEYMLEQAGAKENGYLDKDQWLKIWDDYARDPSMVAKWHRDLTDSFFYAIDQDNSDVISKDEFINFVTNYGASKADAATSFDTITKCEGLLNRSVFTKLWQQYIISNDLSEPGNLLTGKTDFGDM